MMNVWLCCDDTSWIDCTPGLQLKGAGANLEVCYGPCVVSQLQDAVRLDTDISRMLLFALETIGGGAVWLTLVSSG